MEAAYDFWAVLFLICAVAGILSSLFIFFHFRHKKAATYISILTILFSITIADWIVYWTNNQSRYPYFFLITFFFNFVYGPLFYFYLKELIGDHLTRFQRYVHFIPFLSVVIICVPVLVASSGQKREIIISGFRNGFHFYSYFIPFANWLSIFLLLAYGYISLRMLNRFSLYKTVYKWARMTVAAYCIFGLNFLVYEVLSGMSFFNPLWDYGIALSMLLMMFILVIAAYVQPHVFNGYTVTQSLLREETDKEYNAAEADSAGLQDDIILHTQDIKDDNIISFDENEKDEILAVSEEKSNIHTLPKKTSSDAARLIEKLNDLMLNEKLYTQYDLRLDTIADRLYISRKKVSQLINEKFEMNFFEYINTLRIEEAKRMLETEHDLSVKEIMYSVGFNNKVSFYKAFKNKTGITPTDFKMKHTA